MHRLGIGTTHDMKSVVTALSPLQFQKRLRLQEAQDQASR